MKYNLFTSLSITALALCFTFSACKKEEPDTEAQSAVDNSICEAEFSRITSMVNFYGATEKGVRSGNCPTTFIDPADTLNGFPVTLELDYGTTGCTDTDGKTRKGKIIAVFNNKWSNVPAKPKIKLTFQNYIVNNLAFQCDSVTIIRDALYSFTTNVYNGKCTSSDWTTEWSSNRTMTQTGGTGDTLSSNDIFEFTGNVTGKNRNGKNYNASITIPLEKKASCNWIDKGRIDLTPEGLGTRTIDYGIGTCDNDATLSIKGNVFTFKLN